MHVLYWYNMIVWGNEQPEIKVRGWSKEKIKQAIVDKGFNISSLERVLNLPKRSINQSINVRSPKSDKILAAFLGVHESEIWPNRYFANGVSIHASYGVEFRTDGELKKLNDGFMQPPMMTIVGLNGSITKQPMKPKPTDLTFKSDKPKNADGTINHPFYDEPKVTLPAGMKF